MNKLLIALYVCAFIFLIVTGLMKATKVTSSTQPETEQTLTKLSVPSDAQFQLGEAVLDRWSGWKGTVVSVREENGKIIYSCVFNIPTPPECFDRPSFLPKQLIQELDETLVSKP